MYNLGSVILDPISSISEALSTDLKQRKNGQNLYQIIVCDTDVGNRGEVEQVSSFENLSSKSWNPEIRLFTQVDHSPKECTNYPQWLSDIPSLNLLSCPVQSRDTQQSSYKVHHHNESDADSVFLQAVIDRVEGKPVASIHETISDSVENDINRQAQSMKQEQSCTNNIQIEERNRKGNYLLDPCEDLAKWCKSKGLERPTENYLDKYGSHELTLQILPETFPFTEDVSSPDSCSTKYSLLDMPIALNSESEYETVKSRFEALYNLYDRIYTQLEKHNELVKSIQSSYDFWKVEHKNLATDSVRWLGNVFHDASILHQRLDNLHSILQDIRNLLMCYRIEKQMSDPYFKS